MFNSRYWKETQKNEKIQWKRKEKEKEIREGKERGKEGRRQVRRKRKKKKDQSCTPLGPPFIGYKVLKQSLPVSRP